MPSILYLFILIPIIGFVISLLIPRKKENIISGFAHITIGLHMLSIIIFIATWFIANGPCLNLEPIVLFKTQHFEFFISFYFDKITAVYLFVGSFLTFLVAVFSKYYLHRDEGFKRYFNTILFFFCGYNIAVFSGNLETLFIGWEILGISSFLLIAFFRDRYLPVKNALKVFSVYRLGDIGLLLAMWMGHHFWNESVNFYKLNDSSLVLEQINTHYTAGIFISIMIVLAAAVKSAMVPFSSWLPRAMEGPTSSTAIFYGSLSVHLGAFLLMRTFPFWENILAIKILVIVLGAATSIIASLISRVQSSVKTQIAYSTITQIGLIFIEIALGFHNLALVHFAGNAFLRSYQLLVSPSVLNYLIHEQYYSFIPKKHTSANSIFKKIELSVYVLSVKEWNLDSMLSRFIWRPLKQIGERLDFVSKTIFLIFTTLFIITYFILLSNGLLPILFEKTLPFAFLILGLFFVLKSFTETKNVLLGWNLIVLCHVLIICSFYDDLSIKEICVYLSGIIFSGLLGFMCLNKLKQLEEAVSLHIFHGHVYEYPKLSFVFLLSCLGLMAFPISPSFIGVDMIFSHVNEDQIGVASLLAVSFVMIELSLVRIYARVFLGPHIKSNHPIAYKSS